MGTSKFMKELEAEPRAVRSLSFLPRSFQPPSHLSLLSFLSFSQQRMIFVHFFFFLQKFAGWILCAYCRMEQDLPPGGKRAAGAEALTNRQVSSKPPAPSLSLSSTPRARSTVASCIFSPHPASTSDLSECHGVLHLYIYINSNYP